jgi:hypothetical protein
MMKRVILALIEGVASITKGLRGIVGGRHGD